MKVHTKIQKWGNGLALRIGGVVREIPQFKEGTEVDIEVTEDGFIVRKSNQTKVILPYTETQLLADLTAETAHANLLAVPNSTEFEA